MQALNDKVQNPILDLNLNKQVEKAPPPVEKEKTQGSRFKLSIKKHTEETAPVEKKVKKGRPPAFRGLMEKRDAIKAANKEAKSIDTISISITDMEFSAANLQKLKEATKVDVTAKSVNATHVIQGLTFNQPFNAGNKQISPTNKKETTIEIVPEDNGKGISIKATCPHKNEEAVTRQVVREVEKITKGLASAKVEINDDTTLKPLRGALEDSAKKSANVTVESPRIVFTK